MTDRCYGEMLAELGSDEPVIAHLIRVATNVDRPIGVNLESGSDTSTLSLIHI